LSAVSWDEDPEGSGTFSPSLKLVFIATFVSLVLHTVFVFWVTKRPIFVQSADQPSRSIEVDLQNSKFLPVVDSAQEAEKDAPEDAKFASDRNLKADQQTSPERSRLNIPRAGGGAGGQEKAQASSKVSQPTKVMTFSSKDLEKDITSERETLTSGPKGAASAGFVERLSLGRELKLTARALDYGAYINRMRTKLSQRWNPQGTISPAMYSQRLVSIDVAVVLNAKGEIVELRTLEGSRFLRFDEEAMRSLREAAPYPNPPKSLIQDDGLIYMPWTFVLTMDAWGYAKDVE